MAASGIDKIGVNLGYGGFEASAEQHQSDSWSLGCNITIEDADATLQEVRVNDITISGVVSTEELSVDINSLESDSMNLDVNFVVDGISSSLVEAQIVPFDKIIDINDLSPEATAETRFASSARAAKIIYDLIATLKDRVDKIEVSGGGSSEGTGECWWNLDENTGELFTTMPVRVENNIVAYGQVSSGGIGEEGDGGDTGGGTGGGEGTSDVLILDDWDNYDESLPQVLGAVLGMELYRRLLAVEGGTAVPPDLTEYATKNFVETQISNLINGAPEAYDTLKEIADILAGNVNNINDILVAISKKASKDELSEVDTRLSGEIDEIRNLINSLVEMNSYWQLEDGYLKTDYNVYSTKQISSGGIGEEGEPGGGTSGVALLESWDKYDESVAQALGASLGVQLYNRIKSLEDNPAMPDLTPYATKTYVTERLNDLWNGVPSAYDSLLKIANVLQGNREELDQIAQDILNLQAEDTYIKNRLERLEDLWREDEDGNLWTNRNVYSLGEISSGGVGSEGTGGGGGSNTDLTEVFTRLEVAEQDIADIQSVLDNIGEIGAFLPLTGGTISSDYEQTPLKIATTAYEWVALRMKTKTSANGGSLVYAGGSRWRVTDDGWNQAYTLLHEGNYMDYTLPLWGGTFRNEHEGVILKIETGAYAWVSLRMKTNESVVGGSLVYRGGDRWSVTDDGWYNERTLLHSKNFSEYALPLGGGTLSKDSSNPLTIKRTGSGDPAVEFYKDDTRLGSIGLNSNFEPYYYNAKTYAIHTIIHSGNIGSQNVASADMAWSLRSLGFMTDFNIQTKNGLYKYNGEALNRPNNFGLLLQLSNKDNPSATDGSSWIYQMAYDTTAVRIMVRQSTNGSAWSNWKTLAFTDGNVASATKLATSRKIWGQSFDGSADISGALYMPNGADIAYRDTNDKILAILGVTPANQLAIGYGMADNNYTTILYGGTIRLQHRTNVIGFILNSSGNVGIGTSDPAYKLDVNGNLATKGDLRVREGSCYLQNDKSLRCYLNGNSTDMDVFRVSTSNEIEIGGDAPSYGVNTIIKGKKIILRQNIWDTRLEIAENGDTYINKNLNLAETAYINGEIYLGNDAEGIFYYKSIPRFCYHNQGTWVSNLITFEHNRVTIHQHLALANALYVDTSGNGFMMAGTDYYSYIARTEDGQWKEDIFNFYPNGDNYAFGKFTFSQLIRAEQGIKIGDATITWDSEARALKIDKDVYSDGQVSSGGVEEVGGVSLNRVVFTIPSGATSFTCEHGLETKDISVSIYEQGNDYQQVLADVYLDTTNIARIVFGSATDVPHKVVIIG